MPPAEQIDAIHAATLAATDVSSRIEESFSNAGQQLGRGHAIFRGLSEALATLSAELAGAQIEDASEALHDIAERLNGLAQALPAETAQLSKLGRAATEASDQLDPLFKHIQMISIVARSARIEAASLAQDREGFLAFTQEAYELANAVQHSLDACARDQALLSKAVETAVGRQKDFERRYHAQLISEANELIAAYSGMQDHRAKSAQLADLAGKSTQRVAEAVGRSIISLQAGDSTRQRLEHACHGLNVVLGSTSSVVPDAAGTPDAGVMTRLQAMQLKDTGRELQQEIGRILHALSAIMSDAASVVGQGRTLHGSGGGDSSSFLARIRQILAQASGLIATCESAGKSVDDAVALVEETLTKFRETIAGLSEVVVDITLIGMNASLKAGHLGSKGNAFVVIANELKTTADHLSAGAARLKPTLDAIEASANELRGLRVHGETIQLAKLEPQVLHALHEIEASNERLGGLIHRLVNEGGEFEGLMTSASQLLTVLGETAAALPSAAMRLEATDATVQRMALTAADQAVLDDLFARYTMECEREVHRELLRSFGIVPKPAINAPAAVNVDDDDGVLLF